MTTRGGTSPDGVEIDSHPREQIYTPARFADSSYTSQQAVLGKPKPV